MSSRLFAIVFGLFCLTASAHAQTTLQGLRMPADFEVTEFAGSELANDIYCMTLDPQGRVVVSGRGYIRVLVEENGRAKKALDFAGAPQDGAMGLFWEGDDLYCMGDGGLRRYRNASGDGRNRPPELLHPFKTGGEHAAHAIRRGPDGWLYVLCGNNTGISAANATLPTSPIKNPLAGCVLRFAPDLKGCEIVADGLRNAYGFDFNTDGEWFTYDSDNERCVSLPWYEGTRLYHVISGGHYGWQNPQHAQTWRMPPYFADVVAPIATLGRGSPTGVVCYRHVQFPEAYRGGLFVLDWTFGRVWFVKLTRAGSTYTAEPRVFLEATGENGFAPTAAAVHPKTGDLYLSIGGRGTRGAVYRIRHVEGFRTMKPEDAARLQPAPRSRDMEPRRMDSPVEGSVDDVARLLTDPRATPQSRLDAVRWIQRALGDLMSAKLKGTVWEGYSRRRETPSVPANVRAALRAAFPANDPNLDRELSRTLGMIEDDDPATQTRIADRLTPDSNPIDDVHYLIVLARMGGKRSPAITKRTADSLVSLDRKLTERKLNRESNWPRSVGEVLAELTRKDDRLVAALLAHPDFGRPDHAFFATTAGFDRRRAAEIFVESTRKNRDFAWNAAVVELIGELPPERSHPVLRGVWGENGLDETILPILAKHPEEADRERFVRSLSSAQPATVRLAVEALAALPKRDDRDETLALILALRRLPQGKEEDRIAERLAAHLTRSTGEKHGTNREAWSTWFAKKHPDLAKRLSSADGVDVAAWDKRLTAIDWNSGSAERGRGTFTKASCAACHSGATALGPDLRGLTGRFSRADLFTALVQPGKDVSARYRTTQIQTRDGKAYQGIIVYEAVDSVILQTGPAATLRLVDRQIAERQLTVNSLMPSGLLDPLSDQEIADLYAYLKELR